MGLSWLSLLNGLYSSLLTLVLVLSPLSFIYIYIYIEEQVLNAIGVMSNRVILQWVLTKVIRCCEIIIIIILFFGENCSGPMPAPWFCLLDDCIQAMSNIMSKCAFHVKTRYK